MADGKSIVGVSAEGIAGDLSGKKAPSNNATLHAEVGNFTVESAVTVDMQVIRAPFSEHGMTERFLADPLFYRNLASYVAMEIRRQADATDSQGNFGTSTKSQLSDLADGFQSIATGLTPTKGILTPEAAGVVASLVTKLRDTYVAIVENYPALLDLTSIGLAAMAFYYIGHADPTLSLLISAAVVKKEKLADVISSWNQKK